MIEIQRRQQNPSQSAQEATGARLIDQVDKYTPPAESRSNRSKKAFTDVSGIRNYNLFYRIAHEYHERHSPPRLDLEYWEEAAADLGETSAAYNGDPFLMDLLSAVYNELGREYRKLEEESSAPLEKAS